MPTLKDLRGAAGLSQMELANASGVSLETIKKIETGRVERPHPATLRLLAAVLGQVPVVMNGSRGGPVFDRDRFDNTARFEAGCLRFAEGFVPLRRTILRGRISGPLANLTLTQQFGYSRSECDRVLEAMYRFPLPGDAAVKSVRVCFGEVVVQTRLAERGEAEREYAAAREQGRQAALATRESADVFTLQVTGLQPDQEVSVETVFVMVAQPNGVGWQLRVPLTIGPRYSRGDEAGTPASRGQPLQVWADPGHRFGLDVQMLDAAQVHSPSHQLQVEGKRIGLRSGDVIPDRDFLLEWEPRHAERSPSMSVITHEDLSEGMRYFLALITPPVGEAPMFDREVLLLVDRSGSMQGPKWEACRWAVRRFLMGMRSNEYFNIGLFQSRCDWMASSTLPASDANRHKALAFLDAHQPEGGTELGVALEQALRAEPAPGERARHVLIITDAQVSDESRILQLVEAPERSRRVSVISIDSSPRSAFVRALTEAAGGDAAFLSSDPHDEDITSALDRVLDTWGRPLARDVALIAQTGTNKMTRSRIDLGDLAAGRSLWVSGAVSLFAEPILRLEASGTVLAEQVIDVSESADCEEVRCLFGAQQIGRLERLESQQLDSDARDAILDELGYANDPLRAPKSQPVYAENLRAEGSVVHRLLVRESLRFGLVCSATAFVGERVEAGRRVQAQVLVPSALPQGWAMPAAMVAAAPSTTGVSARRQPRFMPMSEARSMERSAAPPVVYVPPFRGVPSADRDEVVLINGLVERDAGLQLTRLRVSVQHVEWLDDSIEVWVRSSDVVVRASVAEIVRLGGVRPLNVAIERGTRVQVILMGRWPTDAGELMVELS